MKKHFDVCRLWWKNIYQALKLTHWKTDSLPFCELFVLKTLWVQIHKRECFPFTNWFFLKALISLIFIEITQKKNALSVTNYTLWHNKSEAAFIFNVTWKNNSPRSSQYVFPPSEERSGGVNVHCYLLFITCTLSGYKWGRAAELCNGK